MEGNKEEYIRVGTCLYKIAQQPLANGTCTLRRIPWSFGTIRQDYGKNNTPPIRKYDGFCTVPSHTDYHKEIGGFYNFLTSSLTKYVFYNWLINNILYLCVT